MCAFAATASLKSKIIESEAKQKKLERQLFLPHIEAVKKVYTLKVDSLVNAIDSKIQWHKKRIALGVDSSYSTHRVAQYMASRKTLLAKRDTVLTNASFDDPQEWLARHAILVGYKFEPEKNNAIQTSAMIQATRELLGINGMTVKKIIAMCITCGVEFGIILLALISQHFNSHDFFNHNLDIVGKHLRQKFEPVQISRFVSSHKKEFFASGTLANGRNMSKNHRDIRKTILERDFSVNDIAVFFSSVSIQTRLKDDL